MKKLQANKDNNKRQIDVFRTIKLKTNIKQAWISTITNSDFIEDNDIDLWIRRITFEVIQT